MKYLILALLLTGCGGNKDYQATHPNAQTEPTPNLTGKAYIISGQSNALNCDWSYFENLTGATTIMTAKGSHTIDMLINRYDHPELTGVDAEAIIFVHGESDFLAHTDPDYYISQVEALRLMISGQIDKDLPILISTLGFGEGGLLRDAVKNYINDKWVIAFDDAYNFDNWGMVSWDGIHFNEAGCQTMMNGITDSIYLLTSKHIF